jgi:hypothetical protein
VTPSVVCLRCGTEKPRTRSAVAFASKVDFPAYRVGATLTLARVAAAAGDLDEARAQAREALEISAAKGHVPAMRTAQALLDELA